MRRKRPRKLSERDLRRLNIGQRYWEASLKNTDEGCSHRPYIENYLKAIHTNRKKGTGLLLWGDNSRGKTWAAASILKNAAAWGYSGYMINPDILKSAVIEKTVFEDTVAGKVTIQDRVEEVDFLVLDDLGKEYRGESGFFQTVIENLLRTRTRNLLPIIVTTNLAIEDFGRIYNKSMFEILQECVVPIQIKGTGDSFRRAIAKVQSRQSKLK